MIFYILVDLSSNRDSLISFSSATSNSTLNEDTPTSPGVANSDPQSTLKREETESSKNEAMDIPLYESFHMYNTPV